MDFNVVQLGGYLDWTDNDEFGALGAGWCLGVDGVGGIIPTKTQSFCENSSVKNTSRICFNFCVCSIALFPTIPVSVAFDSIQ